MASPNKCPDCGTDQVKTLVPIGGTQCAYLCANGHFFLEPAPAKPIPPAPADHPATA